MSTVQIRKQGGAAIMTIPAHVLKTLNIRVGSTLELDMMNDGFVVHLHHSETRKHYTLKELLRGATPKNLKALNKATEWAREGKSVGRVT